MHVIHTFYEIFCIKKELRSIQSLLTETVKIIRYIMVYRNISFTINFNNVILLQTS